jgi:hypothetical protein
MKNHHQCVDKGRGKQMRQVPETFGCSKGNVVEVLTLSLVQRHPKVAGSYFGQSRSSRDLIGENVKLI